MDRKTAWALGERIPKADSTIRVIVCQGEKRGFFYTEGTEFAEVTESHRGVAGDWRLLLRGKRKADSSLRSE